MNIKTAKRIIAKFSNPEALAKGFWHGDAKMTEYQLIMFAKWVQKLQIING